MTTPGSSPAPQPARESVMLSSGTVAYLVPRERGWSLEIDGARQSHIGAPGAAPALAAVRWMLAALGADLPATSAHLGGGLLTLPRVIADRRPEARQLVLELEPALVNLARERFPAPHGVSVQLGDARAWLDATTERNLGAVLIDVFAADRVPPAFTSLECFQAARTVLADTGRLVINSVAGPDLEFTRRELATMRAVFDHVAMIVQGSSLQGMRFGNATLIGSAAPLDTAAIKAVLAGDASRGALVVDLDPIIDGATPITDSDQLWSPEPQLPKFDDALKALEAVKMMKQQVRALRNEAQDAGDQ